MKFQFMEIQIKNDGGKTAKLTAKNKTVFFVRNL